MRKLLAIAGCVLLAACGGEEQGELRQELAAMTKDLRGKVDPLPQVTPYVAVPYKDEGLVDPFQPARIDVGQPTGSGTAAQNARIEAERARPKEPLEAFPLESIKMVGTLTQGKETFGIVRAGPNLFRVKKGNYVGQNFGVVTAIDEAQIGVKELIQDGGGDWVERTSALQLVQEAQR